MPADVLPATDLTAFETRYFEALGLLTPKGIDRARAERAFERALAVRDFEIELYWKRAAYFWGFQAAFLGTIAVLLTGGVKESWAPLVGCLVALVAAGISGEWAAMSRGAKFWQDNWERHVDLLEPWFTGALYRTYPARRRLPRPPSVSRINANAINLLIIFWAALYLVLGGTAFAQAPLASATPNPAAAPIFLIACPMLGALLARLLRALLGGGASDQDDATFANPIYELPGGPVLHQRAKIS